MKELWELKHLKMHGYDQSEYHDFLYKRYYIKKKNYNNSFS